MSFFSRLFGQENQVQCPRCLGKGHVDQDDIKRLKQELRWGPGTCAYCNGKGKVDSRMVDKVAPDTSYLTTDLSKEERKKVFENNKEALERARTWDSQVNTMIHQIVYLHFTCNVEPDKIAELFLLDSAGELHMNGNYDKEKEELVDYIQRIIELRNPGELN